MKINKYIISLLLALPMLVLSSCQNTQDDYFDTSTVERQNAAIEQFRQALVDAEYGWAMDYYPQEDQTIGGFVFCLKFTEDQVTATCEKDPNETVTSYYSLKTNIGPSLSFDTYNKVLHNYFAEGTFNGYQGERGDFEFRLDSIVGDRIYMHSNRNGNIITLNKLTYDPAEYMAKAIDLSETFFVDKIDGAINGEEIKGDFTWSSRQIALTYGTTERDMAYVFTDKGIRLYEDITVGGVRVSDLEYDAANKAFIIPDGKGGTVSVGAPNPEWLDQYYAWQGEWTMVYRLTYEETSEIVEKDVTLVPTKTFETYLIKGLNDNYDVTMEWKKQDNSFYLTLQTLCYTGEGNMNVRFRPYSRDGYVSNVTTYGMNGIWNEETQSIEWEDNGKWTRGCMGFIVYIYDGGTAVKSARKDYYPEYMIGEGNGVYWLQSLKRK